MKSNVCIWLLAHLKFDLVLIIRFNNGWLSNNIRFSNIICHVQGLVLNQHYNMYL